MSPSQPRLSAVLVLLIAPACAPGAEGADPEVQPSATTGVGGGAGAGGQSSGGAGAAGCAQGTADHCGACDEPCPGETDESTLRFCTTKGPDGECGIICRGEAYDVDGDLTNGCESDDDVVHDSLETAIGITLPDTDDRTLKSNPLNIVDHYIFGDDRMHDAEPTSRPNGREEWWRVNAVGNGKDNAQMGACLGITNFPADVQFEVCVSDIGNPGFSANGCAVAQGGQMAVCVAPPAKTDGGDPYYVRVRKLAGTNAKLGYALYLQH